MADLNELIKAENDSRRGIIADLTGLIMTRTKGRQKIMTDLNELIKAESDNRSKAIFYEEMARIYWGKANKNLLDIQQLVPDYDFDSEDN